MMKIFGSKGKSARRAAGLFCFFSLFLSQPSPAAKKRGPASVFQRPSLDDSLNASLNEREGRTERLLTELCSADSSDDKKNCLKTRRLAGGRPESEPSGGEPADEDARQFDFQDMDIRSDRRLSDEIVGGEEPNNPPLSSE